jgi:hypothetical protein
MGYFAGNQGQGSGAIAMGYFAGNQGQGTNSIAIGINAATLDQAANSIVIDASGGIIPSPTTAGFYVAPVTASAATTNVMLYNLATNEIQYSTNPLPAPGQFYGDYVYWDGASPGTWVAGSQNINIGSGAGESTSAPGGRPQAIAVGYQAGNGNQGGQAIAIGYNAGNYNQGTQSIAIGYFAGYSGQGTQAIAIGYNAAASDQAANSIVIDASGGIINTTAVGGFYVSPIAGYDANEDKSILLYDAATGQVRYNTGAAKTFVIDHPINDKKYLVHACIEGPEAGVYYRGEGEITNNSHTTICLPDYVQHFAREFTIQITPIYSGKKMEPLYTSRVENNSFIVYGENCQFYWHVTGKRNDIEVEPSKDSTIVKGSGPYKWI